MLILLGLYPYPVFFMTTYFSDKFSNKDVAKTQLMHFQGWVDIASAAMLAMIALV